MLKGVTNAIIIADLHCGCQLGLCPEVVKLDGGGTYHISRFQRVILDCWNSFHKEWVPRVTRGEPYIIVVNGDSMDHRHHGTTTQISQNTADQQNIAYEMLAPVVDKSSAYYHIRGTRAHTGPSGEEEEKLAKRLGAVPDEAGKFSRYELYLRIGDCLVHITHHIGTTGSLAYETTALMKEFAETTSESARWGKKAPMVVVRCLSEDTEILTENGWKGIDDYKFPEKVMSFSVLTGEMYYETPYDWVISKNEPKMIEVQAKGINFCVTPDHNVIVKNLNTLKTGWRYEKAQKLADVKNYFIPISGNYRGIDIGLSKDEAWLLGVIIGDGTFVRNPRNKKSYAIRICQNDEGMKEIVSCLDRIGVHYSLHQNSPINFDKPRYDRRSGSWIQSRKKCKSVYIPKEYARDFFDYLTDGKILRSYALEMDSETFESYLDGLIFADGYVEKRGIGKKFFNNKLELMDQLQSLLCRHGYKSHLNADENRSYINKDGIKCLNYVLHIKKAAYATIGKNAKAKKFKYGKRSWCVCVPSGAIVIRHKGSVCIVGNSHRHRHAEIRVPTSNTYGYCFTTPGWQLKTPFVYRGMGRISTPQLGGSLVRQGDEEFFTRHKTWSIKRPETEIPKVEVA